MKLPFQFRLLPVVCAGAGALLCLKLASVGSAVGASAVAEAKAQQAPVRLTAAPVPRPPESPPANVARRDPGGYSAAEVEILQALAERRAELDRRAEELQQREVLLKATEQRINEKIAKLQTIEKTIDQSVRKQDEEDDARLKSLVRIYETMKPKEAARILEQLELPILLQVLERMKEPKSAPILASMDSTKAKMVTAALAEKKPQPQLK